MNNKDFINTLAARTERTAKETQALTESLIALIAEDTSDQCTLAIQGFGSFEVKKKMERIVVNPATKQRKLIPPKLVMGFKPSAVLKEKLQ